MQVNRDDANQAYLNKIKSDNNLKECAAYILEELAPLGIYINVVSQHSSTYFKFTDTRLGSLRMADHKGRAKYNFRWNLYCGTWKEEDTKWKTHWYHVDDANEFVERIKQYAATIQKSDLKDEPTVYNDIPDNTVPERELLPLSAYEDMQSKGE